MNEHDVLGSVELIEGWRVAGIEPAGPGFGAAAAPRRSDFGVSDETLDTVRRRGDWLPIPVPGDVNQVLVDAGRTPDPHYDTQARECYWVTSREWWYRLLFRVDGAAPSFAAGELCFDGIDGTAEVYLNGALLGVARNAFRPHRFPAAGAVLDGENELLLRFRSIDELLGGPRIDELRGWGGRRAFLRKPQFNFGWDWALPLPSIGLSGAVRLEPSRARLVDFSLRPFVSGRVDVAWEAFGAAVDGALAEAGGAPGGAAPGRGEIVLRITGHGTEIEERIPLRSHRDFETVTVERPALWWPNGHGPQNLYHYEAELHIDGTVHDARSGRFGFREVALFEDPFPAEAGHGRSFGIVVNGVRIFVKGANWIPTEIWPATATAEQYEFYIRLARELGFTMLRIWGGGIYERDRFYELCDEQGILVWQDFMFASTGFPAAVIRDEVIAEAIYQIDRLRAHPSVALWCGINEDVHSWSYSRHSGEGRDPEGPGMAASGAVIDGGAANHGAGDPAGAASKDRSAANHGAASKDGGAANHGAGDPDTGRAEPVATAQGDSGVYSDSADSDQAAGGDDPWAVDRAMCDPELYTMILRGLVDRHGCGVPYVESSPQSHGDAGNLPSSGNSHLSSWKYALFETAGKPSTFRRHFEAVNSFDSEFCIQGPASEQTIRGFLAPDHHWPPDEAWTYHIQRGHRNLPHHQQTLFIAGEVIGEITDLATYVRHGQAVHVEMMRAELETARMDWPACGGTMVWMFEDCWPTSNWSIIDYHRRPKPALYAMKRACASLLPIIFERGAQFRFSFSNDSPRSVTVACTYGQQSLDGDTKWTETVTVTVPPRTTSTVASLPRERPALAREDYLFFSASTAGQTLPTVTYFPDGWSDVRWPEPDVAVDVVDQTAAGALFETEVAVSSTRYARLCHLVCHGYERDPSWDELSFSDNYFDIVPGESRRIVIRSAKRIDPASIEARHWLRW